VNTRLRNSRSIVTSADFSTSRHTRAIDSTVSTGYLPEAVSAESMTASVPSRTALATSETSARVGTGLEITLVIDYPHTMAYVTDEMLAKSRVATVVAVSCDPGSFARDARILVDGGYRLESVTPIDQFVWSAHVEIVAVFRR